MTAATATSALEAKDARLPRLRRTINRARATTALVAVWAEVWPLPLATAAVAAHQGPLTLALVGCAALITHRAWRTGALAKNVTDTIAVAVRLGWRNHELTTWQLPHLIAVNAHDPVGIRAAWTGRKIEGRHNVPAHRLELVVRPNDSQGFPGWDERIGDWCARRYGFSITLSGRSIPDYVGS
jgi:hypothetical protein